MATNRTSYPTSGRGRGNLNGIMVLRHNRAIIGQALAQHRIDAGITQDDLADRLGLKHGAVSHYENGRNSIPPERLDELASIFRLNKKEFAKFILRHENPWLFALMFGADEELTAELAAINPRSSPKEGIPTGEPTNERIRTKRSGI